MNRAASLSDWCNHFADLGARNEAQCAAFERFSEHGLPNKRDEYWQYTGLDKFRPHTPSATVDYKQGSRDFCRIVLTNGELNRSVSDMDSLGPGVRLLPLDETDLPEDLIALSGQLQRNDKGIGRPIAELNHALTKQPIVFVTSGEGNAGKLIEIHYEGDELAHTRLLLSVQPDTTLSLIETGQVLSTSVIEAKLHSGSMLHHLRVQSPSQEQQFRYLFAHIENGAHLRNLTLSTDCQFVRNETVVTLAGADASAHLAGAVLGEGTSHIDNTLFVEHQAADCESRQSFFAALKDRARSVFQGKILVSQAATRTDGYQMAKGALLSDDARFYIKPELEIYEDEVKCSHGATAGTLDQQTLFYMHSRGIDKTSAERLLTRAFLEPALTEMTEPTLYAYASALLDKHIGIDMSLPEQ